MTTKYLCVVKSGSKFQRMKKLIKIKLKRDFILIANIIHEERSKDSVDVIQLIMEKLWLRKFT